MESEQPQNIKPGKKRAPVKSAYPKGVSGNPGGRPKAIFKFGEYLREFLGQDHPDADIINAKLGHKAVKSRLDDIVIRLAKEDPKILLAYGYGKPVETHEMTGADGQPIKLYIGVNPDDWT